MKNKRPVTYNQRHALLRMLDGDGCASIGHRVGRQLAKRGLATFTGRTWRVADGRVRIVAAIYRLTTAGYHEAQSDQHPIKVGDNEKTPTPH